MKPYLAAVSILALSSGLASAEITTTGEARMGIIDDFGSVGPVFTSRVRIIFTGSGESDTGFSFGATVRADNAEQANEDGSAGSVFISGSFGKLSMGDVDSAALTAIGHVDGVGLTGLGDLNESMFIATGGGNGEFEDYPHFSVFEREVTGDPSLLYEYSTGSLLLTASATQREYTYLDGFGDTWGAEAYGLGAAYTMGSYKFAAGYERLSDVQPGVNSNTTDNLVVGADATFGAVTVKARLGQGTSDYDSSAGDFQDNDQWALSTTYSANALALTAFASNLQYSSAVDGANFYEREAIGLGAAYDLGGGAMVKSGVVRQKETEFAAPEVSETAFDVGLDFSF
jgi:outer membrane protein OmpU